MELMPVSDTARMCRARYLHFPNDPARVITMQTLVSLTDTSK